MSYEYSENILVQESAGNLLHNELGWRVVFAYNAETLGIDGTLGRISYREVLLTRYFRAALKKLNPWITDAQIDESQEKFLSHLSTSSLLQINEEKYSYIRDGIPVTCKADDGKQSTRRAIVIDFAHPEDNDFLAVKEMKIHGELYRRRTDIVGFVNGIPLLFIELKRTDVDVENAYVDNYRDYQDTIPHLFYYNAFVMLSNGIEAKVGTLGSKYEFFHEWKRLKESDEGNVALETMLRGNCKKDNFLDFLENFIVFDHLDGGIKKILAQNHQYLGVNEAVKAYEARKLKDGKLGVFWHTQGSGKSYSMVFFTQKIRRKFAGSPTIVVLTDRDELNNQISGTFLNCGLLEGTKASEYIASSGENLMRRLHGNPSFIFTLIQKFNQPNAEPIYPDHDIIILSDEAHRTQYGIFADNMMRLLPTASRLGFTGTPLLSSDNITERTFGGYISIYDFKRAVEDGATVPLYYENRADKIAQLENPKITDDILSAIEDADLDPSQQDKLAREFSRTKRKNLAMRDLQELVEERLNEMLFANPTRMDYYDRYRRIIDDYNSEQNRAKIEKIFMDLMDLANSMDEEQQRYVREGFSSDEELLMYDLLFQEGLSKQDIKKIKTVAVDLFTKIKAKIAELDHWTDKQETKATIFDGIFYNSFWNSPHSIYITGCISEFKLKKISGYGKIKKGGASMEYYLMHNVTKVALISLDEDTGVIQRIDKLFEEFLLPCGVGVRNAHPDRAALNEWWIDRSIPASRSGIERALEEMNISSTKMLLSRCFGLSLSDQYWICPKDSTLSWHEVNFFENDFSEDIGDILIGKRKDSKNLDFRSPDNTSDGALKKRWKIANGKRCLLKSGSNPFRQQPFNEVIASKIAKRLNIPHVEYDVVWDGGEPYSICEDFIDKDTELVSAWRIMKTMKRDNATSVYRHYVNCCGKLGVDIVPALDRMIVLDYLIANEDRHLNNFGLVRNAYSMEWLGAAPIYDSGSSLGFDKTERMIDMETEMECKPFKKHHEEQLKLVSSFDWIDFDALSGIEHEITSVLSETEGLVSEARREAIVQLVLRRIGRLKEFAGQHKPREDRPEEDVTENLAKTYKE